MDVAANYKHYRFLTITLDKGTAVVRLESPMGPDFVSHKHPMHRELRDVWHDLHKDDEVESVVITGAGGNFFPGPDLEPLRELIVGKPEVVVVQMAEAAQLVREVLEFEKPLVAAVNGTALSIGAVIALLADATVASPETVFQDSHVRMGLTAGDGGAWLWPALVGYGLARRLVLRGHPLGAEEAHRLGLVSELVGETSEILPKAVEVAGKLQRLPKFAFTSTKTALKQGLRMNALLSGDMSAALQMAAYQLPDFSSALDRAVEKQKRAAESERSE
jgi:enoyl-CoA hydratase